MTALCELTPAAPVSSFTIRDLKLADGNLHGLAEQRPPSTARGWCAQQCDNGLDGPLGVDVLQFYLRNVRCLRQQRPRAMGRVLALHAPTTRGPRQEETSRGGWP